MSQHLDDGQIRAALDGELEEAGRRHLDTCSECRTREAAMRRERRPTQERLALLSQPTPGAEASPRVALSRFHERKLNRRESSRMVRKALRSPVVRYGLPVALLLVLILSFPSTRAMADRLLSLFRVQQVTVIPVDFTGLQQLEGQGTLGTQFSQLISDSVTTSQKPGAPIEVSDVAQASQSAGFPVRLPEGLTPSRISVVHSSAFALVVNRTKAQALLNEAGRSDLVLPASVDGATVSVKIPASVTADYGTCPAPNTEGSETAPGSGGSAGRRFPDCIILAEIPSPTVSAPAGVDIAQLAQLRADRSVRDVIQLSPGRDVEIGRERGDWVFPYDPSLSGQHALVRSEDADFVLVDAGSRNGCALGVRGETVLQNGSRLLVGDKLMRIELAS